MLRKLLDPHSRAFTLLLGLGAGLLVLFIVAYPEQAFRASLAGLTLWWKLIFPALMPFLLLTELLTGFGVLHAAGVLLDPLLRRLFRLPGAAGWAVTAGLAGGYPAGAEAAARLHERGLIGTRDAERLTALAHVCNPVTMITVVGVGLLRSPQAGLAVAIVHYAAAAVAAVPFAFGGRSLRADAAAPAPPIAGRPRSLLARAVAAGATARLEDGRTFGRLLGDAVLASIQTLLQLGGFIMLFSVVHQVARSLLPVLGRSPLGDALLRGLLEPHLAADGFAALSAPPALQAALIGAALGWSGLAQHAQVLSVTRRRRLRFAPFVLTRAIHALAAFALTLALWAPLLRLTERLGSGFAAQAFAAGSGVPERFPLSGYVRTLESLAPLWLALLAAAALLAAVLRLLRTRGS